MPVVPFLCAKAFHYIPSVLTGQQIDLQKDSVKL